MPLTDRDPNASGRTSRASNMSASSKGMQRGSGPHPRSDLGLLSTAGVMSMLRTSTELGSVGGLAYDPSSQMPNVPRGVPRRTGASSRMSTASSQSTASKRASSHQARLSTSSGARRSLTNSVPQYVPDTLSPTIMNLPGSSPLIPRSRSSRNIEGRSFSMTHTSTPSFALSSNRSFASLRTHEHSHRPRSPYHYPTRLRRPSYRPVSPALSDITGTHVRRPHGQPGHPRMRTPSEVSFSRDDRILLPSHPARERASSFLNSHSDIPPVPPLHQRIVVEQTRMLRRPDPGSISSGSINQRTDSDGPSSDAPSPPTPKGSGSLDVLVSPKGTHALMESMAEMVTGEPTTGPLYYDYSEQFDRDQLAEPEAGTVPTGFVHRIKTILEERATVEPTPNKLDITITQQVVGGSNPDTISIAELPATPVPRRLTRDLILAALDPSTTEGDDTSTPHLERTGADKMPPDKRQDEEGHSRGDEKMQPSKDALRNRFSILSQTGSSVMDSSTLDFAVRYSIPMAAEPTEDGMSDLLDGYQHTETKQDAEESGVANPDAEPWNGSKSTAESSSGVNDRANHQDCERAPEGSLPTASVEDEDNADDVVERRSNHAPKSSDEQSFKSCTDVMDPPGKEADAKSFTTCKDAVTPERSTSMPLSNRPSLDMLMSEYKVKRPVSEAPLTTPKTVVRKPLAVPPRKSSFSKHHVRVRANSKVSSKPSSKAPSMASLSSSIESGQFQTPPVPPPRESSSSKEAQQTRAVADFLLRLSRPRRFSKATSAFSKKGGKQEAQANTDVSTNTSRPDEDRESRDIAMKSVHLEENYPSSPPQIPKILEEVAVKPLHVTNRLVPSVAPTKPDPPSLGKPPQHHATAFVHQHSLSTPSPVVAEPSSVYSPEESPLPLRVKSSPVGPLKLSEDNRRDSQTTTHLVWHGRRSLTLTSPPTIESRLNTNGSNDETTTDLRLSAYRYPLHYLPDLKEESHEDSSLNTSASNLKNSSFKFPFGGHQPSVGQPSVRASADVDDSLMFGRRLSTRSVRRNSLAQSRGLPSMNFSRIDLISKLNEALDIGTSRSLDGLPDDFLEAAHSTPVRPVTAVEIREKYLSFFASLDELERSRAPTEQATTIMDLMPLKQPYTPEDLMAEIDKLTIPSVGGLTQRLSEFLPSLKEFYRLEKSGEFFDEEIIMEHALEELNEVAGPAPKRSSARLRPVPGSPNLVVVDDGLYDQLTGKEKENVTPTRRDDGQQKSLTTPSFATASDVNGYRTRGKTPLAELEAPSPAVLRTRSLSLGQTQGLRPSLESRLSSRRSVRSMVDTPTVTDTRPWNSDKNYPWATTIRSIDISLPAPTFIRGSPRPGPSPLRARISESSENSAPGPEELPASPTTVVTFPGPKPYSHSRHRSRALSFFTAGKRSTNAPAPGFDASGFPTGPIQVRGADQTHEAGERYPTSALTPPVNAHLVQSHSRSRWSDDSSEDEGRPATSRRLKFFKPRLTPSRRVQSHRVDTTMPGPNDRADSPHASLQDQEDEAHDFQTNRRDTFINAKGMSNSAFHGQRIMEKLRRWWHRGGDLIRTLSGRHRRSGEARSQFPQDAEGTAIVDANGRRIVPLRGDRGVQLWTGV
ncbi:hypothetical protein BDV96DRAFT_627273 [Lophiotrema nucula]|uniref:Uncharacterized protein n=1 Tax=Lophiotrema nucula TaxID=690887 RepID=A0A6A5ZR05_9PLEO|nr:hypothetical protein BDV96DRAFT_627273 [Lophiotrema nucula]